jgi:hypothetical protein
MADVLFLSSVFNQIKIAEPMGVSILTAHLRARGRTVEIAEPSIHGWSVEETVEQVTVRSAPIVAISVLRDKNVHDVLRFVKLLRKRCPDRFIAMGGHGPSISIAGIPPDTPVDSYLRAKSGVSPVSMGGDGPDGTCSTTINTVIAPAELFRGPMVDPAAVDRGKGPGDINDNSGVHPSSTYYDVTAEYLEILRQIDVSLIGESDTTFPELVDCVLDGSDWHHIPGATYVDASDIFRRNLLPPKLPNLDEVPFMARDVLQMYKELYGRPVPASILSSRGCFYRCTFCSVVKYERLQTGVRHRRRSNKNIIEEIRWLHQSHGVSDFNFEDDNFIIKNKQGVANIHDLCDHIIALDFPVSFAFFCRADVVEQELFEHLREAGLKGIYFGVESVYDGDLEFFHKGISAEQMFNALDILGEVGFSPSVDADLRIMLGYITWHPLTTFASLKAASAFIRRYSAPPKLLRRKLRVYAGTEVIRDVERMGLLDPGHKDGWRFMDDRLQGFDAVIDAIFAKVNRTRDKLRTLEKAGRYHGYPIATDDFARHRTALDSFLYDSFDELVHAAEPSRGSAAEAPAVQAKVQDTYARLDSYLEEQDLMARISDGYRTCGFDSGAADLFRK